MRVLALLVAVFGFLASSSAFSATLNVDASGHLLGAFGVEVDGNFYNVQFLDGSCIGLFDECDDVSDLTFQDQASAVLASLALFFQVFVDGPEGDFFSLPELTNGCSRGPAGNLDCYVITPFGLNTETSDPSDPASRVYGSLVLSIASDGHWSNVLNAVEFYRGFDTEEYAGAVYASWALVPEPSAALLLGLGLAGLASRRR